MENNNSDDTHIIKFSYAIKQKNEILNDIKNKQFKLKSEDYNRKLINNE